MNRLNADATRAGLGELVDSRLANLETFAAIDSTNSYLMQCDTPAPGWFRVALTDNQTAGHGRHGRKWLSPPGSGLCLSVAYTFAQQPENIAALTLAIGLGIAEGLEGLGAPGVQLKWPNDLMADDGKLGGILTEARSLPDGAISIVAGAGINISLPAGLDFGSDLDRPQPVTDLAGYIGYVPPRERLAACIIDRVCTTCVAYEVDGFAAFAERWSGRDWLHGRKLTVSAPGQQVAGVGAGIAADGALLVDTGAGSITRVTSGTVTALDDSV